MHVRAVAFLAAGLAFLAGCTGDAQVESIEDAARMSAGASESCSAEPPDGANRTATQPRSWTRTSAGSVTYSQGAFGQFKLPCHVISGYVEVQWVDTGPPSEWRLTVSQCMDSPVVVEGASPLQADFSAGDLKPGATLCYAAIDAVDVLGVSDAQFEGEAVITHRVAA